MIFMPKTKQREFRLRKNQNEKIRRGATPLLSFVETLILNCRIQQILDQLFVLEPTGPTIHLLKLVCYISEGHID